MHFDTTFLFNGLGTKGVMLAPYFAEETVNVLTKPDFKPDTEGQVERFYRYR